MKSAGERLRNARRPSSLASRYNNQYALSFSPPHSPLAAAQASPAMGLAETVAGVALKDRAANEKLFAHRFHVRVKVECTQCLFERVKPFYLMVIT
jgi:hypothetical protein